MFELIDIEDHIPLPAPTFPSTPANNSNEQQQQQQQQKEAPTGDQRFRDALLSAIAAKYLFRVVPDVGLAISLASLVQVDRDAHVIPGQSRIWVSCTFTLVIFRPAVGERLRARVVEQSPQDGIRLSTEFFDQITVPPELLVEGSEWEPAVQQWGVRDEEGAFVRYAIKNAASSSAGVTSSKKNEEGGNSNNNNNQEDDATATNEQERGEEEETNNNVEKSSSKMGAKKKAGSVICCVERVLIASEQPQQALQHQSSNVGDQQQQQQQQQQQVKSEATTLGSHAMKIVASFSACDGLGPEAWFEE